MNTKLNVKQWAIATLAVFVVITIFTFILARLGIPPWSPMTPQTTAPPDPVTSRIFVYLSRIVLAGLFAFIFTKGQEGKPGLGEGIRYGLWMGLLLSVPPFLTGLVFSDWSRSTQTMMVALGIIEYVVCGAVVAQLYKPTAAKT